LEFCGWYEEEGEEGGEEGEEEENKRLAYIQKVVALDIKCKLSM
jgi:hypothetical protein